ncbi:MFS transporter [Brucella pseudogrignonensis]|nr:MFS transporter [Brucella pseudogrignonensis]
MLLKKSIAGRWVTLVAVIAAFLPVVVDMTILHIAVPSLTVALGATATEILWIIDIYPLLMAGLLVPMGTLGDRVGYRTMMIIGLWVFGIASVFAAFAPTASALIGARALLALGGSMIMPSVLALVRQTFEDENERAKALGIWTVVGSAGGAIGPLIGGILLEHFWWGSVFLVNVPLILIVLPLNYMLVPASPGRRSVEWKIGHAMILISGLLATVYAIKSSVKADSSMILALVTFAVGIGLLIGFGRLQMRSASPMLDLRLFRNSAISAGLLMAFVASGAMAGFELVLAQELQYVFGKTPLEAGIFMLPLVVASAISGPVAGALVGTVGLRILSVCGLVAAGASLGGIALTNIQTDPVLTAVMLAVFGFSVGTALLASSVAIMGGASAEMAGAAGSLESTGYELGAALGITFFGVLLGSIYQTYFSLPGFAASSPAASSIGEAMVIVGAMGSVEGAAVVAAAKEAFSNAHVLVVGTASVLITGLGLAVWVMLGVRQAET